MVWAAAAQHENDGKKEFQGRDDDRRGFRNDDDWDDQDRDHHRETYAIGLWGDLPYSDVQVAGVLNLIDDMNSQRLAFTAHDGDLKAGNAIAGSGTPTSCADPLYAQALGFLNALKAPAVFTPGDNDWTDCDRASNGPFNSLERLDHERQLFFSTPFTLGQHHLHQAVQTDTAKTPCLGFLTGTGPLDVNGRGLDPGTYKQVPCVENRRWTYRGVTYATLDIQGSCDNRCDVHPDGTEANYRRDADIAWMHETFQVAKDRDSAAIMFISQADPGFDRTDPTRSPLRDPKTLTELDVIAAQDGFQQFLVALRDEVIAFRKPVVYVHGDSHYFRIDKPFYASTPADASSPTALNTTPAAPASALRLENFTRVETFGDNTFAATSSPNPNDKNNVQWLKVFVDPDSREVFAYQPQIVPNNRVAVPAP